jgi:hypothetical protein
MRLREPVASTSASYGMRSPLVVITARPSLSISVTRADLSVTLAPATPFSPAIGACCGIALPVSTALDSGGFS